MSSRLLGSINRFIVFVILFASCLGQNLSPIPPGTLVLLADGTRVPVERLQPGDMVMSGDLQQSVECVGEILDGPPTWDKYITGKYKIFFIPTNRPLDLFPTKVVGVKKSEKISYKSVILDMGGVQIQCSPDQLFAVFRGPIWSIPEATDSIYTFEWISAENITLGDHLVTYEGKRWYVKKSKRIDPSDSFGISCKKACAYLGLSDYSHSDYVATLTPEVSYEIELEEPHILFTYDCGFVTHNFPFEVMVQIGLQWGAGATDVTWGLACSVAGIVGGVAGFLAGKKIAREKKFNDAMARLEKDRQQKDAQEFVKRMSQVLPSKEKEKPNLPEKPPQRDPDPRTPVGRKGYSESNWRYEEGYNGPANINGRDYSNHAVDRMQSRGIPPSVVENTVQNGQVSPDPIAGRMRYYDPANNVSVVTEAGKVVTTLFGKIGN